jgi:hypothetical protein
MQFRLWLETEDQEHRSLLQQIQQRWGEYSPTAPISPQVLQQMQLASVDELRRYLQSIEIDLANQRTTQTWEDERKSKQLHTGYTSYDRMDPGDSFERVVGGDKDPGLDQTGMELHFDAEEILGDAELKGYHAIYGGSYDDWKNVLVDDGYLDGNHYVYSVEIPPQGEFYMTEDPNAGGFAGEFADRQTPDAQVIFSKVARIPAQYVKLTQVVSQEDYWQERRWLQQMYGGETESDEEDDWP